MPKAFIREPNGECLSLEYPGGFTALPTGITDDGEIIGIWTDPKFGERGFLRRKDRTFVSIVGRFQVGSTVYGFRATEVKRQKAALE